MVNPIDAQYDFGSRRTVLLFRGLIDSIAMPRSHGVVELHLDPNVDVKFRLITPAFVALGKEQISFVRRGIGRVHVDAFVTSSSGRGTLTGAAELGGHAPLDCVIIHWLNLPQIFPSQQLSAAGAHWAGRWECSAAGWDLTIDSRPDLQAVLGNVRGTSRSAHTHTAALRRSDGSTFSSAEAGQVIFGFQMALSCALGRWVAPALPVGFDPHGRRVWEQWAPWRCDPIRGQMGWLDPHKGDDLRTFVTAFIDHWCDPARRDVVRYFTHHLLAANCPATMVEGRIMLIQAGMEYLGWVSKVITGAVPKSEYESPQWPASRKLRTLLNDAGIPTKLPTGYPALEDLAKKKSFKGEGPETLTKVRNMLVHPKDANEPYRIDQLVAEAWHLSLQWGNLLLLAWLGYSGSYQPWTFSGTTGHTPEPVPWAVPKNQGP